MNKRELQKIRKWERQGRSSPPPHIIKQITIKEYQKKYKYDLLIETGTFLGSMVEAQKGNFKKIISIELGINLFKQARKKFINDKNVTIIQGDSGDILSELNINEPAIFWLDGHYSGGITAMGDKECPIIEELDAILNKQFNHILLIDDAIYYTGKNSYPTIKELIKYIKNKNKNYKINIKNDIIRCVI